jgi:hypothetical protein
LKIKWHFLSLLDHEEVSNNCLKHVAFTVAKVPHCTRNQSIQNFPFSPFSPLTTKHADRYMLTVENIIDLFIVWNTVAT